MRSLVRLLCSFIFTFCLSAFVSGANALKVENTEAVAGATQVQVRILADCDQDIVALSVAGSFPSELSNVSLSLGQETQGAQKTYLNVYEAQGYFTAGIIIEWRESAGGSDWGVLPAGTNLHVLTLTCDVSSSASGTLTIDLRDDLGSPVVRPVFTDLNAQSIVPSLVDGGITIVPGPTVTGVSPQWGPVGEATSVTITGTNFRTGATVTFGGQSATNVVVQSSTTITCDTPPIATAGLVDVTVDNGPQYGSDTLQNGFEYVNLPQVTGVSPDKGPTAGGTLVTITGQNFQPTSTVQFDGLPLTDLTYVSSTELQGKTPAHAAGFVDVTVTNTYYGDQVTATLQNGFEYVPAPTITSITPNAGHGNHQATIEGTNFRAGETTVYFGGTPCSDVNVISSTELTCLLPPCPGNQPVDITVETPGGSDTLQGGYLCTNTFRRGDANCDSQVDIADPITILDYLFAGGSVNCLDACDVNDDGAVDISDPIYDLMYLFRQGFPQPPAPFPDLGADPTDDQLTCETQCGT